MMYIPQTVFVCMHVRQHKLKESVQGACVLLREQLASKEP